MKKRSFTNYSASLGINSYQKTLSMSLSLQAKSIWYFPII